MVEKSRFIYQLEYFKKSNHILNFIKLKSSFKNNSQFKVDKSKEVIKILKSIVKKGLSPSAITSFMINPLQFYYQRILKIREFGKLLPEIEPRDKGNVVHETLEEIYKPYISKEIEVGNYDLTSAYQNIYQKIGSGTYSAVYAGNIYTVKARSDIPTRIIFRIES